MADQERNEISWQRFLQTAHTKFQHIIREMNPEYGRMRPPHCALTMIFRFTLRHTHVLHVSMYLNGTELDPAFCHSAHNSDHRFPTEGDCTWWNVEMYAQRI